MSYYPISLDAALRFTSTFFPSLFSVPESGMVKLNFCIEESVQDFTFLLLSVIFATLIICESVFLKFLILAYSLVMKEKHIKNKGNSKQ